MTALPPASPTPTQLVLFGAPVAHSRSAIFQNAALAAAGIDARYVARHVEPADFPAALRETVERGGAGNVTIPHKAAAAALCDRLSEVARRAGAVNTFWRADGVLYGDNTDVAGFDHLARLVAGDGLRHARLTVLGAGGAAAAVLLAAVQWPVGTIRLHARSSARAGALAERLGIPCRLAATAEAAVAAADVVVNATPIGQYDESMPVRVEALLPQCAVVDLVSKEGETAWVRAARARGHRAHGGLPMLLEQGAQAFERWFGVAPDRAVMHRAVTATLP